MEEASLGPPTIGPASPRTSYIRDGGASPQLYCVACAVQPEEACPGLCTTGEALPRASCYGGGLAWTSYEGAGLAPDLLQWGRGASRPGPFVPPLPPEETIMSSPSNDHFGHNSPLFCAASSPAGDEAAEVSIKSLSHYTGEPHFEKLDTPGRRTEIKSWCLPPERADDLGPLSSVVAMTRQHDGNVDHPEHIVYELRATPVPTHPAKGSRTHGLELQLFAKSLKRVQ